MPTALSYGDETSDERCERLFIVACVLGLSDQWESFIPHWLGVTGGQPFHTRESKYAPMRRKLVALLGDSPFAFMSFGLDLPAFRRHLPGRGKGVPYQKCFSDAIHMIGRRIVALQEQGDAPTLGVAFTFDHRHADEASARAIYGDIVKDPMWPDPKMFSREVSFDGRSNPRLQTADLFASIARVEFDRPPEDRSNHTPEWSALPEPTGLYLDDTGCRTWAEFLDENEPVHLGNYEAWLVGKKKVQVTGSGGLSYHDNMINRIAYSDDESNNRLRPILERGKKRAEKFERYGSLKMDPTDDDGLT